MVTEDRVYSAAKAFADTFALETDFNRARQAVALTISWLTGQSLRDALNGIKLNADNLEAEYANGENPEQPFMQAYGKFRDVWVREMTNRALNREATREYVGPFEAQRTAKQIEVMDRPDYWHGDHTWKPGVK